MSDYLWDKTGETDEEIERLEETLRPLRYQHQALELPAHAKPGRRAIVYLPLAAAAILALVALVGMRAYLLRRDSHKNLPQALSNLAIPNNRSRQESKPTAPQTTFEQMDATVAPPHLNSSPPRYQQSTKSRRTSPRRHNELLAAGAKHENKTRQQTLAGNDAQQLRLRDAREGKLAKERLMFALNITSRKLNIAQRKMNASRTPGINEENR